MRAKRTTAALAGLLLTTGLSVALESSAQAAASCEGTYTIAVSGTGNWLSGPHFAGNVHHHLVYPNVIPNGASAQAGVNELDRVAREQRNACPNQHIKIGGYSLGAAVVHIWVTNNWRTFDNVNAVLVSDPKRQGPPGANGGAVPFAGIVGAPLAGADKNFGDIPVKTICDQDYVCDESAGIWTYPLNHIRYDYDRNMNNHNDTANEVWYNGAWYPA